MSNISGEKHLNNGPYFHVFSEAESILKQIPSSINEIKFVEPEKLHTSAHSAQNVTHQRMVEDTAILAVPNEEEKSDQQNERQDIEVQSDPAMKSDDKSCVKTSINKEKATVFSVKNEFRKRRNEEADDVDNDGRNINDGNSKRVCKDATFENPTSTEAPKHQSLSIMSVKPSVDRDIEMNVHDRINRSNGQHIHNMAEVIMMAAGNVIRTLQYNSLNSESNEMRNELKQENFKADQGFNRMDDNQHCSIDIGIIHRLGFDTTVYTQRWIIRKFVNAIITEPDYGEEIDENFQPIVDIDIDEKYDSVSNPQN